MLVAPGVKRVLAPNPGPMTLAGTNTYILGERHVAVIDAGPASPSHLETIVQAVRSGGGSLELLLVTHGHPDHLPGALALKERTGVPIGGFELAPWSDLPLRHGQRLVIDGLALIVLHTPGHSSDHVVFLLENERVLFSGDHILGAGTSLVAPPDGDMAQYLDSLRALEGLDLALILPGHGPPVADPKDKISEYMEHRLMRERQIVGALRDGPKSVDDLVRLVYTDVPTALRSAAARSVEAHLVKLLREGRVRTYREDAVTHYGLN